MSNTYADELLIVADNPNDLEPALRALHKAATTSLTMSSSGDFTSESGIRRSFIVLLSTSSETPNRGRGATSDERC